MIDGHMPARVRGLVEEWAEYEAIYDHGQLKWLTDKPPVEEARVIVTLIPSQESAATKTGRVPSARIAGKGRILGDLVAPVAPEGDWDAHK